MIYTINIESEIVKEYYYITNKEEVSHMKEQSNRKQPNEIVEEVNIYTEDCGRVRLDCVTDCFFAFPFLSSAD